MAVAFNTSNVEAYVDENSLDFYKQAIMPNDVMSFVNQYGYLRTGVKANSFKLPSLSSAVGIKSGDTCQTDFDNGNDTTIDQTTISMTKGFIGDEICIHSNDLEDYFTSQGLTQGQHYMQNGLGALEAGILTEVQEKAQKKLAQNYWLGTQSGDSWSFSGWHEQLLAAVFNADNVGTTTPTSGGSAGTDAAGVYNICESLFDRAVNDEDLAAELYNGNMALIMSPKEFRFYWQNYRKLFGDNIVTPGLDTLANGASSGITHAGTKVPIVVQNALTGTGTVILTRRRNFVMGVDAESDLNRFEIGMDQYREKIWWKYRFKVGVGFHDLTGNSIKYWGAAS